MVGPQRLESVGSQVVSSNARVSPTHHIFHATVNAIFARATINALSGKVLCHPMTVVATLSLIPVRNGSQSDEIAAAIATLDTYDVEYELNAMGTVIEADGVSELFAAVQAAHQAIEADRVNMKLEVDDDRTRDRDAAARVAAVEDALDRAPRE